MPRKRSATPPSLPGDPAGPGWQSGLGHHTSFRSIAASAEVVGKLAGRTEGVMQPGAEKPGKLDARRDGYGDGSSPSRMAHSCAIQHNSYRYLQGLAGFEALKISQARPPPALAKQGRGCVH